MVYAINYGNQLYMSKDDAEIMRVLAFIDVIKRPADLLESARENAGKTIGAFTSKGEPVLIQAFSN